MQFDLVELESWRKIDGKTKNTTLDGEDSIWCGCPDSGACGRDVWPNAQRQFKQFTCSCCTRFQPVHAFHSRERDPPTSRTVQPERPIERAVLVSIDHRFGGQTSVLLHDSQRPGEPNAAREPRRYAEYHGNQQYSVQPG